MTVICEQFFLYISSIPILKRRFLIVYLPIYFQACKLASPIGSGVDLFGLALTIAPFAIFTGLSVQILKRYRPQNYIGWVLNIVGFALLSTLSADSAKGKYIAYEVVLGIGLGMTWISTQFPILAPLPYSNNAHALAFFTFLRCFAQVRVGVCPLFRSSRTSE
jgi:hypothetical protein